MKKTDLPLFGGSVFILIRLCINPKMKKDRWIKMLFCFDFNRL